MEPGRLLDSHRARAESVARGNSPRALPFGLGASLADAALARARRARGAAGIPALPRRARRPSFSPHGRTAQRPGQLGATTPTKRTCLRRRAAAANSYRARDAELVG